MRSAIISLGSKSSVMTENAMKRYFDTVDMIDIHKIEINFGSTKPIIYKGKELPSYDSIYVKGSFRYSNIAKLITKLMQNDTYMPIKSSAFTIAHNKTLTHLYLQKNNIPMPRTYVSSSTDAAKSLLKNVGYPIIMKFPEGTQGKGVMFAESYSSASSLLDALGALKQPFLIQEYIETEGEDIRAFVVGDTVVAAMKRKSGSEEKRSNLHAGGKGIPCKIDRITKKIAVDTARAIGAEICGVDILESAKGPLVLEANISPGIQGITEVTGVDIAGEIAKYIYAKTKARLDKEVITTPDRILKDIKDTKESNKIITPLSFRGDRILLPEFVAKIGEFSDNKDYIIEVNKGVLSIKEFKV